MQSAVYQRFMASTNIDYVRWHDGEGYDLAALGELAGRERTDAERWLVARAGNDWRDLEGLVTLGTASARAAVVEQLRDGTLEQRLWAARYLAGDAALAADREAAIVAGLRSAVLYGGLTVALDLATEERTPAMIDALFRACLRDQGEAAVHAAARLAFIHGKAKEEFDWELRPLFLRFNTTDAAERAAAFRDLCKLCGVDPATYIGPAAG
jgi:hypothetical protein